MMPLVDLDDFKPTWKQRQLIQMYGKAYVGSYAKPEWSGELPFYAFRCRKHGIVVNYLYGYSERLECPKC